jgi:hypothetical protein
MLAVNTDMKAPKDVNAVSVTISTNGAIKHSFIGRVTPQGEILLPATLAIVEPEDVGATIRIRVMAFQDHKPRVLRDVRTTVPSGGRTALLRIPLNFVNDGLVVGPLLPANGTLPDPVPGTGGVSNAAAASAGVAGAGGVAEEFDFVGSFQPPCDNIQDETIIDGECKDNYVDPETLPDFDEAALGDSTDTGTCFDLARCFAGAIGVGDATGDGVVDAGTTGPGPVPDAGAQKDASSPPPTDSGAADGSASVDAAAPAFKDFGIHPSAVTLDRSACVLQLNGANPARLNLALVTPDTGACVRPGECYVPIDRGAGGWKDDNGRVQLPSYVCKLLNGKNLRLATSTEVCAAKEESNPICTPKLGDPVEGPTADGGPKPASSPVHVVPEDFATSVAASNGTLFFASSSRVGRLNLFDAAAVGVQVPNVAVSGSARLPWRFSSSTGGPFLALANGTSEGFFLSGPDGAATKIILADAALDVAGVQSSAGQLAWVVRKSDGSSAVHVSGLQGNAVDMLLPTTNISSIIGGPLNESLLVGGTDGTLRACVLRPEPQCFTPINVPGRVDAFSGKAGQTNSGYVLASSGIYRVSAADTSQPQVASFVPDDTSGVDEGVFHYARGLANNGPCVFYTSKAGLSYAVDNGTSSAGALLVPAPAGAPLFGVTLGPDPGNPNGAGAIYYATFAPRDQGGGVWRIAIPSQCGGAGPTPPPDGGIQPDLCGPSNCPGGCCQGRTCVPGDQPSACGQGGAQCVTCAPTDFCDVATRACTPG